MKPAVLVVTPNYAGPDEALSVFIHRQVMGLVERGFECHVLNYRPAPPPFPRWLVRRGWLRYHWRALRWPGHVDGIRVHTVFYRAPGRRGEDVVPAIADGLAQYIERQPWASRIDMVYAHWLWTGGAAAIRLRERFGWPVAAIARGSEMHVWQGVHPHCRAWVERVVRDADCVLTNCRDLRDRAEAMVPGAARRIDVVYNGWDTERFQPVQDRAAVRRRLRLPEGGRILLFCGDVIARKGIAELAAAWAPFSAVHRDWRLIVVGRRVDSGLAARLEQAGNGRVRFTGEVALDQVLAYMQAADALVQPSRQEGLANATAEAMAVGLPVVSTDTCGQRELVQDGQTGWLVPPEDPAALEAALHALAADPDRARAFGRAGRDLMVSTFDHRRHVSRLAAILANLGERPAPMAAAR